MDTRTGIKLGKAFLFRFHRRVNSKRGKILLKAGFQNLKLGIRLRQSNFENLTQNFTP